MREPPDGARPPWQTILRHPIFLFLVVGGVLYAIAPSAGPDRRIQLSAEAIETLQTAEARRRGALALTEEEKAGLVAQVVEEEVLLREARRLGLDRDDAIVRRRLIQKMLLLAEDLDGVSQPPTDAEVRAWFESTRDRWRTPPRHGFVHVFARADHRDALAALTAEDLATEDPEQPPAAGEAFPLARRVPLADDDELAGVYGAELVHEIAAMPVGVWSAPIRSRFGWHRVKVLEREAPRPATLAEVRAQVEMELTLERKHEATRHVLTDAFPRYEITVADRPWTGGPDNRPAPIFASAPVAGLEAR